MSSRRKQRRLQSHDSESDDDRPKRSRPRKKKRKMHHNSLKNLPSYKDQQPPDSGSEHESNTENIDPNANNNHRHNLRSNNNHKQVNIDDKSDNNVSD